MVLHRPIECTAFTRTYAAELTRTAVTYAYLRVLRRPCVHSGTMINFYQMRWLCRLRVVAICLAGSLLFNPAPTQSSDFGQRANDEEKYSACLVVAPSAKSPKYLKYQDGRQQVIYSTESEYPAEDVLSFIGAELKNRRSEERRVGKECRP